MKQKKFTALLLTATMILSNVPVLAADIETEFTDQGGEVEIFRSGADKGDEEETEVLDSFAEPMGNAKAELFSGAETGPEALFRSEPMEGELFSAEINGRQPNTQPVSYLTCDENGQNWQTEECTDYTIVETDTTTWGVHDGKECWYVVSGDVTIESRVTAYGNVHLILEDGCSLTVNGGINTRDSSFTIYAQSTHSMGKLFSYAKSRGNAGIGGNVKEYNGAITINGGDITAKGSDHGAGIGGGSSSSGGHITINGGRVDATAGYYAAGIGGGSGNMGAGNGDGGNITIHGGTVIANSDMYGGNGASIGGGRKSSGGNIIITGGDVTANGWGIGAGGGGYGGTFRTGVNGNAFITAERISDQSEKDEWSGMIFIGNNGGVYGNQTLQEDLEIKSNQTLLIPKDVTLTVGNGVTLTNNGSIIGTGMLTGGGSLAGSGNIEEGIINTFQKESTVSVSVSPEKVTYGSIVAITATISQASNMLTREAEQNKVVFYLGTVDNGTKLGTADVLGNTASLEIDLSKNWDKGFQIGENTITAEFGGNMGLKSQSGTVTFTIDKAEQKGFQIADVTGKKYGDAPFSLSTTGGSGTGEVTFSVPDNNGVLTISGEQATIIGAGMVEVTANKAGDDHYKPASVALEITIGKATPTPDLPNGLTAVYGDTLENIALPDGWGWDAPTTSVGNVGKNEFSATYTPDNSSNYDKVTQKLAVEVSPAVYQVTLTGQADNQTQITLHGAKITPAGTDVTVTYAMNTRKEVPAEGWQTGRVFSDLTADTTYYFFAKATPGESNRNYQETISEGVAIKTKSRPVIPPPQKPLPENVPDGSQWDGENIVTPNDTVIKPDGTIVLPDGTALPPQDGKKPSMDKEGTVLTTDGIKIDKEGNVTVPGLDKVSTEDDVTVTIGKEGKRPKLEPKAGKVTVSKGSKAIVPDGKGNRKELEIPEGTVVTIDGLVTFPDGTLINQKGEVHRTDGSIWDLEGKVIRPGTPVMEAAETPGGNNRVKAILAGDCAGAIGYDYVISENPNCIVDKDYYQIDKNQLETVGEFTYVQEGIYYVYCHAWTRNEDNKKIFSKWSNGVKVEVTARTPQQPQIKKIKITGRDVSITYSKTAGAEGYDLVLGKALKKVNGELRPVDYGKAVKKVKNKNTVTVIFKNVPKGTYYVGLHSYNRTSEDGKKVFSPWSKAKRIRVK